MVLEVLGKYSQPGTVYLYGLERKACILKPSGHFFVATETSNCKPVV